MLDKCSITELHPQPLVLEIGSCFLIQAGDLPLLLPHVPPCLTHMLILNQCLPVWTLLPSWTHLRWDTELIPSSCFIASSKPVSQNTPDSASLLFGPIGTENGHQNRTWFCGSSLLHGRWWCIHLMRTIHLSFHYWAKMNEFTNEFINKLISASRNFF